MTSIDSDRILVLIYNKENATIEDSFIYYRNGPWVITDDPLNGVSIFNKKYHLEFSKNKSMSLTGYKSI
jgi:hypothetical protein